MFLLFMYILILSNQDDFTFMCYGGLQLHICIYSFYLMKKRFFLVVYILILSNAEG